MPMKMEDIIKSWEVDSEIKREDLESELIKITKLHSKYLNMLTSERVTLSLLMIEMKELKKECFILYTQGGNDDQWRKGDKEMPVGKILKSDVQIYIDADKDVVNLSKKIELQKEKVEFLLEVMKQINGRGFYIKSIIDLRRYNIGE